MTVSIIATAPAYTGTIGADADTIFDFTGSQIALDAQTANTVLAGPASGAAADPAFRALVNADLPNPPLRVVTDAKPSWRRMPTVRSSATKGRR